MKINNKLYSSTGKLLSTKELVTLKGGSETLTGYKCKDVNNTYLGCVNLVSCDSYIGNFYCKWLWASTDHVEYSCGAELEGCHQW